jgi:hypothetical protein
MRYIGKFAGFTAFLVLLLNGSARSQLLINGAGSTFTYPNWLIAGSPHLLIFPR